MAESTRIRATHIEVARPAINRFDVEVLAQRYRVDRVLHSGIKAEVYEASDLATRAADKVLVRKVKLGATQQRAEVDLLGERWLNLLTHFRHDGLLSLLECSWDASSLLLVSEPPSGKSIDKLIRRSGTMDRRRSIDVVLQLCDVLDALHELGLAHQDLRPGTIFIGEKDRVQVSNAGLWALYEAGIPVLDDEEAEPAIIYKAPEQFGVVRGTVGAESDLYAIGVVLYEMLTGRKPFSGETRMQINQAKVIQSPSPPSRIAAGVGEALDRIVLRLLNPLPEERYRSARGLKFDLERILAGETGEFEFGGNDRASLVDSDGRLQGRDWERSFLLSRFTEAARGKGGGVILRGPSGIGKTRLMEEVAFEARKKGGIVLWAKGRENEAAAPLTGFRQLLSQIPGELDVLAREQLQKALDRITMSVGSLGSLLRPLSPFTDRLFSTCPPPPPLEEEAARVRLMRSVSAAVLAAADEDMPLCVVLDDLQWFDGATLTALEYLAHGVGRTPVLVLASMRPVEEGQPAARAVAALEKKQVTVTDVGGLNQQAVYEFLVERLGDIPGISDFARRVHDLTDGNPSAMRDALADSEQTGILVRFENTWRIAFEKLDHLAPSENVVRRMLSRLSALPEDVKRCLAYAGVWGRPFDLATLQGLLSSEPREKIVSAVVEAERADLLRPVAGSVGVRDFVHDTVREAALRLIPSDELRSVHRAAARSLASEETATVNAEQKVAHHFLLAGAGQEGFEWYLKAARASLMAYSGESAVRFGEAALRVEGLDPLVRAELLGIVARGHLYQSNLENAAIRLGEILSSDLPVNIKVDALVELAHVQHVQGNLAGAVSSLDQGLGLLNYHAPRSRAFQLVRIIFGMILETGIRPRKGAVYRRSRDVNERFRNLARLLLQRAKILFFMDREAGFLSFLDGLRFARRSRDLKVYSQLLAQGILALGSGLGKVKTAWRTREAAIACAKAEDDLYSATLAEVYGLGLSLDMDRYDAVTDLLGTEVRDRVYRIGDPWMTAIFETLVGEAWLLQGKMLVMAKQGLKLAEIVASGSNKQQIQNFARSLVGWVAAYSNRPDLAMEAVNQGLEATTSEEDALLRYLFLAGRAHALSMKGDTEAVVEAARDVLKFFDEHRVPRRYTSKAYCVTAEALVMASLKSPGNNLILELLRKVTDAGRATVACYSNNRLRLRLARAQYHMARGNLVRARFMLRILASEAARLSGRNLAWTAAPFYNLAMLKGGATTADGLRLLERAARELSEADEVYWLKRAVSVAMGSRQGPSRASQDQVGVLITRVLGLPESMGLRTREASGASTTDRKVRRELVMDLMNQVARSLSSLARGDHGLESVLGPVTQFAGAETGGIVRHEWGSETWGWIARIPADGERVPGPVESQEAVELLRQCTDSGEVVIREVAFADEQSEAGTCAAVPLGTDQGSSLVLYLENRYVHGVFGTHKLRTIGELSSILVAASVMSERRMEPSAAVKEGPLSPVLKRSECAVLRAEFMQASQLEREMESEDLVQLQARLLEELCALQTTPDDGLVAYSNDGVTLLFAGRAMPEDNCKAGLEAANRIAEFYKRSFTSWLDQGSPVCRFGLDSGHANHGLIEAGGRSYGFAVGPLVNRVGEIVTTAGDGQVAMGRRSKLLMGKCPDLDMSRVEEKGSGLLLINLPGIRR